MNSSEPSPVPYSRGFVPLLSLAVLLLTCFALDPAGDRPGGWEGPGLTLDEPFHVAQGVQLAGRVFAGDLAGFRRVDSQLIDHPPLGRLWLGVVHEFAFLAAPPLDPAVPYSIRCARIGSALLFALTVWRVGCFAQQAWGFVAGGGAALALTLMPRSFGHGHLASLETPVNLCYLLCLLAVAKPALRSTPSGRRGTAPPRFIDPLASWPILIRVACHAGCWLGLALLTKMQAVFLPVILAIWALGWLRTRAVPWLLVLGGVAAAVFLLGWPHLWSDPVQLAWRYLTRSTERISLLVWYQGRPVPDSEVPWHYPWVVFSLSVPLGLHLLGFIGGLHGLRSPRKFPAETLLLLGVCVPLLMFSLPGVPVYDGERLFSVVYPPWATLIGKGAQVVYGWCLNRRPELGRPRWQIACLLLLGCTQGVGLFRTAPCWLQYYNFACGGLPGAVRLGLSPGYWGDGLTSQLLSDVARQVPPGSTLQLAPVLYPAQCDELLRQAYPLKDRKIRIIPRGTAGPGESVFTLLYNRPEYLPVELQSAPPDWISVRSCEGVWQAGLFREN
jgi:hypothetical protein